MKKRILFVDDEALVLQGLERSLRSLRGEWDMAFASGGMEALDRLGEAVYDVVVSDLQMPGMDGVDLLTRVRSLYPSTVRMALSGQADQQTALRCLEVAHQYLSKPCDPELLKARIRQAGTLGRGLPGERTRELANLIDHLPALPAIYRRVKEALDSDQAGTEVLGQIIGQDPGMTARLLQVANSGFFGQERRIADPTQAVTLLGSENVRSLLLARGLFDGVGPLGTRTLSHEQVWAHSLHVASGARALARLEGASGPEADEAFTAGLLHDAGILVLASRFGRLYEEVIQGAIAENLEVEEVERRTFGATHSGVGACLLGLWGLPERVVEAAGWHHSPSWSGQTTFGPLTVVHAADVLGEGVGEHPIFERTFMDNYHLLVVGKQDRLHVWKGAIGRIALETEEPR